MSSPATLHMYSACLYFSVNKLLLTKERNAGNLAKYFLELLHMIKNFNNIKRIIICNFNGIIRKKTRFFLCR